MIARFYKTIAPAFACVVLLQMQSAAEAGFLVSGRDTTEAASIDVSWFGPVDEGAGPVEPAADDRENPPDETRGRFSLWPGAASPAPSGGMNAPSAGGTADFAPFGAVVLPVAVLGPQNALWMRIRERRAVASWQGRSLLRPPREHS